MRHVASRAIHIPSEFTGCTGGRHALAAALAACPCPQNYQPMSFPHSKHNRKEETYEGEPTVAHRERRVVLEEEAARPEGQRLRMARRDPKRRRCPSRSPSAQHPTHISVRRKRPTDRAVEDRDRVHDRRAVLRDRRQLPAVPAHVAAWTHRQRRLCAETNAGTYRSPRTRRSSGPARRARSTSASGLQTRTSASESRTHARSTAHVLTIVSVHKRVLRVARERRERNGLAADVHRRARHRFGPGAHLRGLAARCSSSNIRQLSYGRAEWCRERATHG